MMDVLHHIADPGPVLAEMARTVDVGGVVILADFTPEGFGLVARVHRAEGRVHSVRGATVGQARRRLEREGLACIGERQEHLHEVAILVKRDARPIRDRSPRSHR